MNNNDFLLLLDINDSLQRSLVSINSFIKYQEVNSENFEFQKKVYEKYTSLTFSLLEKRKRISWLEKGIITIKYLIFSMFKIDSHFFFLSLEKDISNNMRKVILSEGDYNKASSDIKLLTKYYLSIETRLINEIRKLTFKK